MNYDVAIVGAGVVGTAIARELSRYHLSVALLDAADDVGEGTSKANTAILHTGFDASPGTLESRLVSRGYELLGDYAEQAGIPVERTGAVLVAWTSEEWEALPTLRQKARDNGYTHCEIITPEEIYRDLPHLGPGALGGLTVPGESIICPWTPSLAFSREAVENGTTLLLGHRVESVETAGKTNVLNTSRGSTVARWVINAAGLGSDMLDRSFGYERFIITPRRGELLVFDKLARPLVDKIVLPVPTKLGKGVLVSPTVYGNVMLGPTAEDLDDRNATHTSETGFSFLREKGQRLMPDLFHEEVTTAYAGLRAATDHSDYIIETDEEQNYMLVGGIRSTGLTSAMAIAEYVSSELQEAGLPLRPRDDVAPTPKMPNIGESSPRPYQQDELIATDPAYGTMVCFCERVTAGEIRDALKTKVPPVDRAGLARRTRATNGRCQGFYCGAAVQAQIDSAGGPQG